MNAMKPTGQPRGITGPCWRAIVIALILLFVVPLARAEQSSAFQTRWNKNLGLFYVKVWKSLALDLGVAEKGLLVTGVLKDSSAHKAGIMRGDIIIGVRPEIWNGQGKAGQVKVSRDGEILSLDVAAKKHAVSGETLVTAGTCRSKPKRIVVDPTGNGDFRTVTGAMLEAIAGDTVLVKAGTFREGVLLSSGVTIQGAETGGVRIEASIPFQLVAAQDATLQGLTIRGSDRGVYVLNCSKITVIDCDVATQKGDGISVTHSAEVLIQGCNVSGTEKTNGIVLCGSQANISDNIISGYGQGILVKKETRAEVEHNLLDGNEAGIAAFDSQIALKNNAITGKGKKQGIYFQTSEAVIQENSIRRQGAGIHAWQARGQVVHNTVSQSEFGIMVKAGSLDVSDNVVLNNKYYGINVYHDDENLNDSGLIRITRNRITGNDLVGIRVSKYRAAAGYNLLEGNGTGISVDNAHASLLNNTVVLQKGVGIEIGANSQAGTYNNIVAFNAVGISWDVSSPLTTGFNDVFGNFAKRTFPPQDGNYFRKDRLPTRSGEMIHIAVYPAYDLKADTDFGEDPKFTHLGRDYRLSVDSPLAKKTGKDGVFIGAFPVITVR